MQAGEHIDVWGFQCSQSKGMICNFFVKWDEKVFPGWREAQGILLHGFATSEET